MFSSVTVSLLAGTGTGAWVYAKMMRSTGNNLQTSLSVAAMAGFFAFLAVWQLIGLIPG